jgi:Leucine-rich repeat (LRR) protein
MKTMILLIIIILSEICKLSLSFIKFEIKKPYKYYNFVNKIEEPDDQLSFDKTCPSIYINETNKLRECSCNTHNSIVRSSMIKCNLMEQFPFFKFSNKSLHSTNELPGEWNIDFKCNNITTLTNIYKNIYELKSIKSLDLSYDENIICHSPAINDGYRKHRARLKKIDFHNYTDNCNKNDSVKIEHLRLENNYINEIHINLSNLIIENIHLQFNNLTLLTNNQVNFNYIETTFINISYNLIQDFDEDILYSNLKSIDLSHNKLQNITKTQHNLKYKSARLKHLNLSHNLFHNIPFNNETNLTSLQLLNLSSNFITKIDKNNFLNFPQLKFLYLDKNQISSILESSFKYLNNLELLDLSSNLIKNLTSMYLFQSQIFNLKYLNLNLNFIESLNSNTLKYLQNCMRLFISNNKLVKLQNYTFGYMKSLIEIDLSGNLIQTIDVEAFNIHKYSYLGPGLIEKLDLSSNLITTLPPNLFQYLTNLRYLLLNKNMIKTLDTSIFNSIHSLIHFDLSLNSIVNLNFLLNENLKSVKYLKLSNNFINQIPNNQFIYFKQLRQLDLSSNQIRTINDCSFYHLKDTIRKIILNYNLIHFINSCAFQFDFKHIRFLHLLNNPINCTANCHFYNILQNRPYALNYYGNECSANNFDFSVLNCTNEHYTNITLTCQKRNTCMDYKYGDSIGEANDMVETLAEEHSSNDYKLKNEFKSVQENLTIESVLNISNQINLYFSLIYIFYVFNFIF